MADDLQAVARVYSIEALVPGGYVRHHVELMVKTPAGTLLTPIEAARTRIADLEAALAQAEADKGRLDEMQRWADENKATGYRWFAQHFESESGKSVREQLDDAARGKDQPTNTEGLQP